MATKKAVAKPATTLPVSTDPNVIYQQLAQMPMGGATPFDQTYNDAVSRYKAAQNSTYVLPDVLKSYLGQVSPQYTQDKQAVLNQFADKSSPLYISNPFARLQAAQAATQGQQQTYSQVLDRVNRLVGMGVNQQQQNVQDLGSQVTSAQQAQKDARAAMQQQFSNAESLQRLALAKAAAYKSSKEDEPKYTVKFTQPSTQPTMNYITGKMEDPNPGGLQFFKDGVPASPNEYANGVGKSLAEILASSPSSSDQQFAKELAGIMDSGDTTKAQTFREQHPWLFGDIIAQ